jgi:peptidase E
MLSQAILLGPQRHVPIVRPAIESLALEPRRPLAVVTAGWEEREEEIGELRDHLRQPVVNLALWQRVERIFARDHELGEAMRRRHDRLRQAQELYRIRLTGLMEATRELFRRSGDETLLEPERNDALVMLQALDAQHMARVAQLHHNFEAKWQPLQRDAVQRERRDLARLLADASCLLIAGGHISVLLHRLRLFDLLALHGDRPVVAWSAGAMVLTERIVLFHDFPPQGTADAEVMEGGFGVLPDLVALPHAQRRLRTDDERALRLFAGRFAPAQCVLLDNGSRIDWRDGAWHCGSGTRRISAFGGLEEAVCRAN